MSTSFKDEEIPNSEGNPFCSFFGLLVYGKATPASLATAVEEFGVYGWDRYGRFRFFKEDSVECKHALDGLANAWEGYKWIPSYEQQAQDDPAIDGPLNTYGWAAAVMPNLDSVSGPKPPERKVNVNYENANLAIVGALLAVI